MKVCDNQSKLPYLFKQDSTSSTSSSTDDTIILSDSDELNFETYTNVSQTPVTIDEIHAVINKNNQELGQDPPQTPVPIDETHAIVEENKQDFCRSHPPQLRKS